MQSVFPYGIIIERDCDRYAMKREVAAEMPVFPWSMSDFKPGDRYFGTEQGHTCAVLPRRFFVPFPD
ncbi:MAG: hypothetical protein E7L17_08725 [Clostridium sp.]|uniref:hypothetical protein n=1 Tax=Clostridium sp. TaxID=1506 RepID=UPI00290DAA04|nr:hypothetical protein [Clostridium sp.]MDU7338184.1 hypothetical protein [Clostridium sp.]